MVYQDFINVFKQYILKWYDETELNRLLGLIDFEKWIHEPGLPPHILDFVTPDLLEAQKLADEYIQLNGTASPDKFKEYNDWYSSLKVIFLERLIS